MPFKSGHNNWFLDSVDEHVLAYLRGAIVLPSNYVTFKIHFGGMGYVLGQNCITAIMSRPFIKELIQIWSICHRQWLQIHHYCCEIWMIFQC